MKRTTIQKMNKSGLKIKTDFDPPVFEELAKIQENIGLSPSTEDSDYGICRAYNNSLRSRCSKTACKSELRGKITVLLLEFRHMTECGETDDFYDKIKEFITLTYCFSHYKKAIEAFTKWKTERMAVAQNRSFTLPTRARSSIDSPAIWHDARSGMTPTLPISVSGNSRRNEPASNLCIEEKMDNLAINTNPQNTTSKIRNKYVNKREELEDKLKALGDARLPSENAQQNHSKIQKVMKVPLCPGTMSKRGILYILRHTSISGIFKIGFSEKSADHRHKQHGNCYGVDTEIVHETAGKGFAGARQAERIVHAVLDHKNIPIANCPHCKDKENKGKKNKGSHKEWFLTSEDDAIAIVKVVETWMQMPAYIEHGKIYILSPRGESIFQSIFGFSIKKLKERLNNENELGGSSTLFPVDKLETAIQQTTKPSSSPPVTESGASRDNTDALRTSNSNQRRVSGRFQLKIQQLKIKGEYNHAAGTSIQTISMKNQELNIEIHNLL
ncbi:hypothetical protein ACSS6W_008445 [Trichoderma asperelloides]